MESMGIMKPQYYLSRKYVHGKYKFKIIYNNSRFGLNVEPVRIFS
jgi:hypothetical protein